jgi:3',5'-cyclic AMP phosphodiesterase CpdA
MLQVSDPHFGTERPEAVRALLQLATKQRPDVLVLSGDITQRARRRQFAHARRFADDIGASELLAIPGNHDIPLFNVFARVFRPYGNYARYFGTHLEPELSTRDVLVLTVNTTRPRRHKHGEISRQQIERVARRLHEAGERQVRVVVVHQPVLAIRPDDIVNLLRGSDRAVPTWSAAGADLILGGHIHIPYVRSLRARFSEMPRNVFTAQAGTAVSRRVRDGVPNSVNLLRCDSPPGCRRCTVERWDYADASASFELNERQELRFDPAGPRSG